MEQTLSKHDLEKAGVGKLYLTSRSRRSRNARMAESASLERALASIAKFNLANYWRLP